MTMLVADSASTSAAGPMRKWPAAELPRIVLLFGLAGLSTSSEEFRPDTDLANPACPPWEQTSSGCSIGATANVGTAIAELRRLTGFTWEQLARLLKVSRRSVHFWASGKVMSFGNEEHLQRILAVARKLDRGSVSANRAAFLTVHDDGASVLDLLADKEYERAASTAGPGSVRRVARPKASAAVLAARAPRAPADLVDDHEDRVPRASGRLLASKPVRVTRRK